MSWIIAAKGIESEKVVDGQRKKVLPFVGADREGEFAQMGVGILLPNENTGYIWGLVCPHNLIQSWRGMKLLEKVERIEHGTLCGCWTVSAPEISDIDRNLVRGFTEQLGGSEQLEAFRRDMLISVPSADELETMLTVFREKKVDIADWELMEEVRAGRIRATPLIETIVNEAEARKQEYQRQELEIKRLVPPEDSLGVFFSQLGIGNFTIGGGFGGYGWDWGHLKLGELDSNAKHDSFSKYLPHGFRFKRTDRGPDTEAGQSPDSFGEIDNPSYLAADGIQYIFLSAKWEGESFHILTLMNWSNVMGPHAGFTFTVAQLRRMLQLPVPERPLAQIKPIGWLQTVTATIRSWLFKTRR
ncbi:MAG: hypothetical protein Q7R93_04640 [bacterium]|nr:hypothetical protein [bacterium]